MKRPLIGSTLVVLAAGFVAFGGDADSRPPAFVTAPYPTILLSANDGECRFQQTVSGLRQIPAQDSITVFRLGPDHPPRSKTVVGTVPVTIHGSPHVAISANGRYGFVSNHNWRDIPLPGFEPGVTSSEHLVNVLTAIDLATEDLKVVDQVELPAAPWMVDLHPDGNQIIVSVGAEFRIFAVENDRLSLKGQCETPATVFSFDVSPRGDRIIAVTVNSVGGITDLRGVKRDRSNFGGCL